MKLGPDLLCWAVWNAAIAAEDCHYSGTLRPKRSLRRRIGRQGVCADGLSSLAERCGFDSGTLIAAILEYNQAVVNKRNRLWHRHVPRALAIPPFYAVRHRGASMLSFAGLAIGLFNGQTYAGGMAITPALTFGRLISERVGTLISLGSPWLA